MAKDDHERSFQPPFHGFDIRLRPPVEVTDPLAELARIVGAEDPFANLFDDARAPEGSGRQQPQGLPGAAARAASSRRCTLPRALGLRGAMTRRGARSRPLERRAGRYLFCSAAVARGLRRRAMTTSIRPITTTMLPVKTTMPRHSVEPRSPPYVGGMMALGLLAFAVLGGGVGYAWTSGLFDSTGLPGNRERASR